MQKAEAECLPVHSSVPLRLDPIAHHLFTPAPERARSRRDRAEIVPRSRRDRAEIGRRSGGDRRALHLGFQETIFVRIPVEGVALALRAVGALRVVVQLAFLALLRPDDGATLLGEAGLHREVAHLDVQEIIIGAYRHTELSEPYHHDNRVAQKSNHTNVPPHSVGSTGTCNRSSAPRGR